MKEELNAELEKGYADILAGRTKPAKQALLFSPFSSPAFPDFS